MVQRGTIPPTSYRVKQMTTRNVLSAGLLSLVLAAAPLASALAQSQPGDPPDRVGRLAEVSGTVTFHGADQTQWSPASVNYPVTGGNAFWTEPRSHAAIDVGASRLYMDAATELDVSNVDDQSFTASLAQGAIYLRVSPEANGDQYEIDTPRGAVHIVRSGDYEVIAGDQDHPTTVMAFNGGVAEIVGPGVDAPVNSNQAVYVSGQDQYQVNQGDAQQDDFIQFVQAQEQPYQNQNQNAGPPPNNVSPQMTGYQDLNRYGQWGQDASYGQVWYPQVAADWAPYRNGHWAYVSPWGWTWIDDAPWGFTPFHYGRWVQVQNRWAWWPGRQEARPVYAPALVTFFGNVGGVNLALSFGGGQQNVGWIPLAPDEVYVPPYRHSPTYVRNVNITYVRNETTIINVVNNKTVINNYDNFHNHNGATIVNASTMEGSRPVATDFRKIAPTGHVDNKQLTGVKVTEGNVPVKPTNDTRGTTFKGPSTVTGPNVAESNTQIKKGKGTLPPLTQNSKYSQEKNGQKNGQGLQTGTNGQNGNGQNGNNKNLTGQNGNGQNQNGQNQNGQNGQFLKNTNQGVQTGTNGQNGNKNVTGQNGNGQNQNGQNQNGQNGQFLKNTNQGVQTGTNGQNGNGQNGNKNVTGQNSNGQNQNGQKLKNGQGVAKDNKLPPLPPSGTTTHTNNQGVQTGTNGQNGNNQNGNGQNGQNFNNKNMTGQNGNGQNQNGQNGNGQNLKNQNQTIGNNKQPVIVPNQNNTQNNHSQNNNFGQGNGGQGNGQAKNGQFNQGNQGQFSQGQGQGNQKYNTQKNGQSFTQGGQGNGNQKFTNQPNNNGQNFLKQGNGGPQNQKVQQKNNNKKIIPPDDNNGQSQHKN